MKTIAALYVMPNGVYQALDFVDCYDEARDARLYLGPLPVVAHPPCQRYGRFWYGGPSANERKVKGDDGGCFVAALASVRAYGGVLEHPEASHAWRMYGIMTPPKGGGWIAAGDGIGWTCCVEQGNYGHKARKATWLYAVRTELPSLKWGDSGKKMKLCDNFHTAEERDRVLATRRIGTAAPKTNFLDGLDIHAAETIRPYVKPERLNKTEILATPIEFRDLLVSLALSVRPR